MQSARVRIRNVKPKGNLAFIGAAPDVDRSLIEKRIRAALDNHGDDYSGYAIVIWSADGASTADMASAERSRIPEIVIPDFIRNRLLAWKIEAWVKG